MKVFQQFMKNIGGRRKSASPSASKKRRANSGMKEGSVSGSEETTSHCSFGSAVHALEECWRVERIRVGAPGEADWWKEDESVAVTTDDTWLSSGVSGESLDGSITAQDSGSLTKKFHNCGLETWEASRAAWKARPDNRQVNSSSKTPVNRKELGKILTKANSLRTYELPRRMPLKDVVESYVMVWSGQGEL